MAGGASAALLAREGDKHLMVAVGTANSGKAFLQIATLEKGSHRALNDRPPEAVLRDRPQINYRTGIGESSVDRGQYLDARRTSYRWIGLEI